MRPVSSDFRNAVTGSHTAVFEARVVDPGQTGTDPDGITIPILGGDVQLDVSAESRSTVDLTTDGRGQWNTAITPYGPELWIRRGIDLGGNHLEWVSLGYHKIYTVEQDQAPDGPIRLAGRDRMAGLIDSRMIAPKQFGANHTVRQFFELLVLETYPWAVIEYDFNPDGITVGRGVVVEQDRYAALLDMARSLGKVMHWDHAGVLQVRKPPNPTRPVYEVATGPGGVLVELSRSMDREGIYNAVVATGEAGDDKPPARGVARDMNPASPTYWFGPFGQVPRFYSSPLLTTDGKARTAAATLLQRVTGLPYSIDFGMVPNPALEPLDPVRIRHRDGSEIHVIQTLTVPLTPGETMAATTREQTDANIETGDQ